MTTSKSLPKNVASEVIGSQIVAQAEDPSGARAVEVSAVFDNTVQQVRHFANPRAGRISKMTKGVLTLSALSLGSVLTLFGTSYAQVSAEKNTTESSPKHTQQSDRTKERARDIAAGTLLMLGAAGLAYGMQRLSGEQGESEFSLGTDPRATYQVSTEGLPCERFPLVRSNGSSFELLVSESMKGSVTRDGKMMELHEFAQSEKAVRDAQLGGTSVLQIPEGVRFAIEHGGSTFLVQSVVKPRYYPVPLRIDWATQSYTGAVMAGAAAFVGLMFVLPPDAKSLSLDGFDAGRLIKLTAKPEVDERPDWLDPKKKVEQPKQTPEASSSRRAHAANPVRSERIMVSKNPGPVGKKEQQIMAASLAQQSGIVVLLRGGALSTITRDSALGNDATQAMDGLVGTDSADPYASGGQFVATGPSGGGGDGTINTSGLGPFGPGGPGGPGGAPRGPALRQHRVGGPTTEVGRVEVNAGSMDREVIRRVIRSHMPEVKFCYERALMSQKELAGRVQVKFMINPAGKVLASVVEASTLHSQSTEQCVAEAVRRWEFPKPPSGIVSVTYPFVFKPAGE